MSVRCVVLPAGRHENAAGDRTGAVKSTRLGGTELLWSEDAAAVDQLGGAGALRTTATALALVTQVGGVFEREYPAVRVIVNHGRHLIVELADLPPATTCWRVEPLTPGTVVDRPEIQARQPDPVTETALALLSSPAFAGDLGHLVGYGTRHSLSPGFANAAAWCADRLRAMGYAITMPEITVGPGHSVNVVADRPSGGSGSLVLITAHLDSVNLLGGPSGLAPGADDNGSGSAGLLELARVLATRAWRHDLRLILFGGEEQGLHGSRQYVAALPAEERARVRAVLNMDMVATRNTVQPTVLLEGSAPFRGLIDDLAAAAAAYTGLRVETSLNPFASDHVPFLDAGIPAVLTIEGSDSANTNIHTGNDTLAHIDLDLMHEILRMNLAALVGWLEPSVRAPMPAGPVVARAVNRLDVFVAGTDSELRHWAWDGGAWQPSESLGAPGI